MDVEMEVEVEAEARVTLKTLSTGPAMPAREWGGALPAARAAASGSATPVVPTMHLNSVYREPDRWCEWC